jgi:hypothetical protein
MPFVTFTVRRGLGAADKSRLSEAMLEAQVTAGYHRADRFHRFLEVDGDDLLVDPRFPDYATDRTDRFMVFEVVISGGRPTGTAATIAEKRSDCSANACTSRLRTSCSPSTRWNRTSRAFLLRRSGEIRPRMPEPRGDRRGGNIHCTLVANSGSCAAYLQEIVNLNFYDPKFGSSNRPNPAQFP